jgi:hypothetical protein
MTKNTYCGLCMECLRTCPHENIAIQARTFGADLGRPSARLDEAFKSFVMLGSAMVYAAVLLGPWGGLKDAAYRIGTLGWFLYALVVLAILCGVLPGLFALALGPRGSARQFKQHFARMSGALIPMGLTAWIAFSLSFVLNNAAYIGASLSDPLGLGWDLLGTAHLAWQPVLTGLLAPAQALALLGGVAWSGGVAKTAAAEARVSPVPVVLYCAVMALVMLWLLL